MGEPVKIVDLARDLIQLSALREDEDVKIHFTGPRPGERLFEEVFLTGEEVSATEHPKVLRVRHADVASDVEEQIEFLAAASGHRSTDAELRRLIAGLVPAYAPPGPVMDQFTRDGVKSNEVRSALTIGLRQVAISHQESDDGAHTPAVGKSIVA